MRDSVIAPKVDARAEWLCQYIEIGEGAGQNYANSKWPWSLWKKSSL